MSLIKDVMKEKMQELEDKLTEEIPAKLDDPELKAKIVKKLNDNVNIPIINESTEGKIIGYIYDIFVSAVKKALTK
tara:strand:- start:132 stop:359 length:228 start_codon:yes stop_codon:yes gene_type:complete